jgi:large subunit ribosomal protein L35
MPKMKSHRGVAKRFKVTSKGKIRRRRANANHLLEKKASTRKRRLTGSDAKVSEADAKRVRRMLGA